jgi:hypothetical protein
VNSPTHPHRRPDLIFRKIDDDICVYDPIHDRVLLLNATSALILDLCDGTRTWEQIEGAVAAAFPVDPERISHDVATLRDQFRRAGLFRRGPA